MGLSASFSDSACSLGVVRLFYYLRLAAFIENVETSEEAVVKILDI
jgi:hypothetical protein